MPGFLLITGASRGIGAATAELAAAEGYVVGINYRTDEAAARRVRDSIAAAGGRACLCGGDIATGAGVSKVFEAVDASGVPFGGLVNNAGVVGAIEPFTAYTEQRLRHAPCPTRLTL
ncbi:MAG: SDR family NAD(P)-dependent oxidoreductase [Gammaproteobacteria bacterium]